MKIKTCVKCGGKELRRARFEHRADVGSQPFSAQVPGQSCSNCGIIYYDLSGLQSFSLEAAAWLAGEGVATGEAMKFMRKVLGLTAAKLAELLSLTAETISRIETGKLPADARTVALLGAMVLDKRSGSSSTIDRLGAIAKVERLRDSRVAGYREQLKKLPPGPQRDQVKTAMQDWLTMGPKRKEGLAELHLKAPGRG